MSIPIYRDIRCPKCGKQYEVQAFESLNTDYSSNVASSVISGKMFKAVCPACGYATNLEYDLLYHDLAREAYIWVVHQNNRQYSQKVSEIRATDILSHNYTRLVGNFTELREKVSCLEAGRDDRIIEIYKLICEAQVIEQYPSFEASAPYYSYQNGKEMITFRNTKGEEKYCFVDSTVYQKLVKEFASVLRLDDSGRFPIVDSRWAGGIISSYNPDGTDSEGGANGAESEQAVSEPVASSRPPVRYCRICGAELNAGSKFCTECGTRVLVDEKAFSVTAGQKQQVENSRSTVTKAVPAPVRQSEEDRDKFIERIKKKVSQSKLTPLSLVSFFVGVGAAFFCWLYFEKRDEIFQMLWVAFSIATFIVAIIAKLSRETWFGKGKAFEIIALVLGFITFYNFVWLRTEWSSIVGYAVPGIACFIYAKVHA